MQPARDLSTPPSAACGDAFAALLRADRPLVMGILNVTPDSFSDGGAFLDPGRAIAHARTMIEAGADILDAGAESTRPYGSVPITADEEWQRLAPILPKVARLGVALSIDTMKAAVAEKAVAAGATVVNDVWGLQRDSDMASVVAAHGCGLVIMHNRETVDPALDIFADVDAFFTRSLALADRAGVRRDRIVLDPGIGFGKTPAQSIALIAQLDRLSSFGLPLLMGLSRKRFIASVSPSEPHQRLGGSIAANLHAVRCGARVVRVHDVAETVQALRIEAAIGKAR